MNPFPFLTLIVAATCLYVAEMVWKAITVPKYWPWTIAAIGLFFIIHHT